MAAVSPAHPEPRITVSCTVSRISVMVSQIDCRRTALRILPPNAVVAAAAPSLSQPHRDNGRDRSSDAEAVLLSNGAVAPVNIWRCRVRLFRNQYILAFV